MPPDTDEEIADAITRRQLSLNTMLVADGFALESRGNRSVRLNTYLDYNYSSPDGRSAQIKFRPHLGREVRLTIRSTF
jgi:hypothetical protein